MPSPGALVSDPLSALFQALWANLWIGALLLAAIAPYAVGALTDAMQRRVARRTRDLLASAGIDIESEPRADRARTISPRLDPSRGEPPEKPQKKHRPPLP